MKYLSAVSSYMHDGEMWMKLENWCKNYYMRDLFHQAKKLYTVFSGLQPEGGLKEFENWKPAEFSMKIH